MSGVDGLKELLNKAKYLRQIQCMNGYYQCKQVCSRTGEECKKELGLWLSEKDVAEFFKDRTFFLAKECSLRKVFEAGVKDFLNTHRCISSEAVIPPWKRDEIKEGILKVFDETFSEKRFKGSVEAQK